MMDINRKSTTVVQSWEKTQKRQTYTHVMTKNAPVSYTWAFQRTNQPSDVRRKVNDVARIFSITVTNAVDGVSSSCQACALSTQPSGSACVPCPPGHYIDSLTSKCLECPHNSYLEPHRTQGSEACKACGPSSRSDKDHRLCYSDCHFTHTEGNVTLTFDFSLLNSAGSLMNGPKFTSKGTKYFHMFNISLCGGQDRMAVCTDNVTDVSVSSSQSEKAEGPSAVKTFICQSTIIPASRQGFHAALSSQSINLADTFLGRSAVVTLRCNPDMSNKGVMSVPRLEYKYSRLVMSANKECEMPVADSCAVMEGENEGDMEDEVVYTKPSLLGKLKAIASKGNGESYENVQLSSSHSKALVWS
ncbi:hypothetical protein XENORESO_009360 [Xenotaenia resolanae]|uniref:MRH domain-containing protein n=1 Tax=Xenotaenia resolanae TaxID=208358 RepID=A0ABV0X5G4_9TELE